MKSQECIIIVPLPARQRPHWLSWQAPRSPLRKAYFIFMSHVYILPTFFLRDHFSILPFSLRILLQLVLRCAGNSDKILRQCDSPNLRRQHFLTFLSRNLALKPPFYRSKLKPFIFQIYLKSYITDLFDPSEMAIEPPTSFSSEGSNAKTLLGNGCSEEAKIRF